MNLDSHCRALFKNGALACSRTGRGQSAVFEANPLGFERLLGEVIMTHTPGTITPVAKAISRLVDSVGLTEDEARFLVFTQPMKVIDKIFDLLPEEIRPTESQPPPLGRPYELSDD